MKYWLVAVMGLLSLLAMAPPGPPEAASNPHAIASLH
jgi:hypothetical protein